MCLLGITCAHVHIYLRGTSPQIDVALGFLKNLKQEQDFPVGSSNFS